MKRFAVLLLACVFVVHLEAQRLNLARERFQGISEISGVTCSGDGKVCAYQSQADNMITLVEAATGHSLRGIAAGPTAFLFRPILALNQDGSRLMVGEGHDPSTVFSVWDVVSGYRVFQRARPFENGLQQAVAAAAFSADGKLLATVSDSGQAEVWDAVQWRIVDSMDNISATPRAVNFSSDTEVVFTASRGNDQAWTLHSGKLHTYTGAMRPAPATAPRAVAGTPLDGFALGFELTADDRLLLPGPAGRVFDLRTGTMTALSTIPGSVGSVDGFDVPGGAAYAVWDWTDGHLIARDTLQPLGTQTWASYRTLAVSPDGKFVAAKRGTKAAIISTAGKTERVFELGYKFERLRFSSDGGALIASGDDMQTRIFSASDGKPLWQPVLYSGDTVRDDLKVAAQVRSGGTQYFLRIVDLQHRQAVCELALDAAPHPQFSADGKLLAVGLRSGGIVVLDLATRQRVAALSGFPGGIIEHMRFTADNRRLVASGLQNFIRVWDLGTQKEILGLSLQGQNWAAFTPSGFYDGNDDELKNFYWVQGSKTQPLGSVAADHRVVGLAAKVWAGQAMPAAPATYAASMSGTDLARLELMPVGQTSEASVVTVSVRAEGSPPGGVTVVGVRNGVPLQVQADAARPGVYSANVRLESGANHVTMWAVDTMGRESAEVTVTRDFKDNTRPRAEIVAQSPQDALQALAFSRDGSKMATAQGHAITLWDMRTRRQLRTLFGHANAVRNLDFDGTSDLLASSALYDGVRVWSTRTGDEVCRIPTLTGHSGIVPFTVSPDGKRLAIADYSAGLVRIFQFVDCAETASFEGGLAPPAWVSDHKLLMQAEGSDHKTELVAVDLDSGAETNTKAAGELDTIAALPDGRALVLLKDGKVELQSSAAGELQIFALDPKCNDNRASDKPDKVMVLHSGRVFFDYGKQECLYAPDLKTVESTWTYGYLYAAAVSGDERLLGMVDTLGKVEVYNRLGGAKMALPAPNRFGAVTQLVFSKDGDVLASGRGAAGIGMPGSGRMVFWDLAATTVIRTLEPLGGNFSTANWFLTSGFARIGDVSAAGIEDAPFPFVTERGQDGELSVVTMGSETPQESKFKVPASTSGAILSMQGFRLSGKAAVSVVAGHASGEVDIQELGTARPIGAFRAHAGMTTQAALSSDGSLVLTAGDGSNGNSVRLWKSDGTPVWRLEGYPATMLTPALAFSDDNTSVAIASEGRIQIVDAVSGVVRRTLMTDPGEVTALAFAPDGARLAAGTGDGLVHLFDCSSGKLLVTLAAEADGTLAYTPEGFYRGTLARSAALSFRVGEHVYPLQQFDLYYNRPDLLMQAMAPELQPVIRAYKAVHDRRLQEAQSTEAAAAAIDGLPELNVTAPASATLTTREFSLPVSARPVGAAALSAIEVRVNGVADPAVNVKGRKTFAGSIPIVLSAGANNLEITAVDAQSHRSLTQQLTVEYKGPATSTLYLVPVGVSTYSDTSMNLQFAGKDAKDLAAYFNGLKGRGRRVLPFDNVVVTEPLTDAGASRAAILQTHGVLAQAGVDDTVVLFFAGHGMLDKKNDFYFAPFDMDFAAPATHGISIAEMEALLGASHSRKRLLMVDACHSGELDKGSVMSTAVSTKAKDARGNTVIVDPGAINAFELLRSLFVDLRENTGTQIISASRGEEVALETKARGNGLFTGSVLDGLRDGNADADGDGHISVSELLDFVSAKVEELSHGRQTPTGRQQNIEQDFLLQ